MINDNERARNLKYQNLLHVTLYYNKYSIKEFFEMLEKENLDMDPDELLKDPDYNDEFNKQLVKDAKEKLYPYRDQVKAEEAPVDVSDDTKKKKEKKEPFYEKIKDVAFDLYDAPRRMSCGMKPFDLKIKSPFKKKDKKEEKTEKENDQEKVKEDVINKDGTATGAKAEVLVVDTPEPEQPKPKQVFKPVEGVANVDVQNHFNNIIGLIKDRVVKGTTINVSYNNTAGSYTATVTSPDGKVNSFTVDVKTFLPDYYSILTTTEKYGTLAIPFEHEVSKQLVNEPMFKVPDETIEKILDSYYFNDIGLYYVFDFSSIKGLNKMGKKKRKRFEAILTKLKEDLKNKDTDDVPRFRFSKFESPENFQIISDIKCKMPLAYVQENSSWIANATFDIKAGVAYQLINNVVSDQKIA